MNENQKQILAEAFNQAFEIIERNLMKVIDEKFDAIMDGKGEADSAFEPITEDRIREIAEGEAMNIVNGATIDICA